MSFKNIILTFFLLLIINKALEYLLRIFSVSVYSGVKSKGLMNVNLLNSMNKDEFFSNIVSYLEYKEYKNIQIVQENILLCHDGKKSLGVFVKKLDVTEDIFEVKEVLTFLSKLHELKLKKAIIITNGVIGENIYKVIDAIKEKNIDVICINGVELAYELRNLSVENSNEEVIL